VSEQGAEGVGQREKETPVLSAIPPFALRPLPYALH